MKSQNPQVRGEREGRRERERKQERGEEELGPRWSGGVRGEAEPPLFFREGLRSVCGRKWVCGQPCAQMVRARKNETLGDSGPLEEPQRTLKGKSVGSAP